MLCYVSYYRYFSQNVMKKIWTVNLKRLPKVALFGDIYLNVHNTHPPTLRLIYDCVIVKLTRRIHLLY